jgi:hypothetical protein
MITEKTMPIVKSVIEGSIRVPTNLTISRMLAETRNITMEINSITGTQCRHWKQNVMYSCNV